MLLSKAGTDRSYCQNFLQLGQIAEGERALVGGVWLFSVDMAGNDDHVDVSETLCELVIRALDLKETFGSVVGAESVDALRARSSVPGAERRKRASDKSRLFLLFALEKSTLEKRQMNGRKARAASGSRNGRKRDEGRMKAMRCEPDTSTSVSRRLQRVSNSYSQGEVCGHVS